MDSGNPSVSRGLRNFWGMLHGRVSARRSRDWARTGEEHSTRSDERYSYGTSRGAADVTSGGERVGSSANAITGCGERYFGSIRDDEVRAR